MPATCKCPNGHTWSARIIEDSPDINVLEVAEEDQSCPECSSDQFEIVEVTADHEDFFDER